MRPHGHVIVDPSDPRRSGSCDRCGFPWNFEVLQYQLRWAGTALINTGYLVCPTCLDDPAPFERIFILPPDPPPSYNGRIINYLDDEEDYLVIEDDHVTKIEDEDGTDNITKEGDPSTTGNT